MTQERSNLILKGVLMVRRLCDNGVAKDEDLARTREWYAGSDLDDLRRWVDSLREDLMKTPEQREEESRIACEELAEAEARMEYEERMAMRSDRTEWDDLWEDRARECGAICW